MRFIFFVLLLCLITLPVSAQSWCGQQDAYFNHSSTPDVSGYELLMNFPSGAPEIIENVTVINTGGPVLIDTYIMPAGSLNKAISLEPGVRMFRVYSSVSSNVGTTKLNFTAFRRFANGTEQNFYTALSGDINDLTVAEQDFLYVSSTKLMLSPTDRLGVRVSANTTHSAPITVNWYYQGETHYSMFVTGFFDCEEKPTVINAARDIPVSPLIAVAGVFAAAVLMYFRKRG